MGSQVKGCMGPDFFTTCSGGEIRLHARTSWAGTAPTAGFKTPKSTSSGDRTHDHKIKSLALYHLSYGGPLDGTLRLPMQADHPRQRHRWNQKRDTQTRDRTGDLLRVKQTS